MTDPLTLIAEDDSRLGVTICTNCYNGGPVGSVLTENGCCAYCNGDLDFDVDDVQA